ncbi:MAG: response regulator [Bacteriovoracaceae bacterium]|nr:response regulator [Bacteriovoracaceae bacterium]
MPNSINFLVVDDYPSIRKMLKANLKDIGFKGKILEADSASSALEVLAEEKIDFIISDWRMPKMSGLEFLEKVRSDNSYDNVPFLFVTTVNEKDNVIEAIKAGASNYMIKPWKPDSLAEKIGECWKKHNPEE